MILTETRPEGCGTNIWWFITCCNSMMNMKSDTNHAWCVELTSSSRWIWCHFKPCNGHLASGMVTEGTARSIFCYFSIFGSPSPCFDSHILVDFWTLNPWSISLEITSQPGCAMCCKWVRDCGWLCVRDARWLFACWSQPVNTQMGQMTLGCFRHDPNVSKDPWFSFFLLLVQPLIWVCLGCGCLTTPSRG